MGQQYEKLSTWSRKYSSPVSIAKQFMKEIFNLQLKYVSKFNLYTYVETKIRYIL